MSAHATTQDLSLLIDGELPRRRVRQVEQHLDDCDECRQRYLSTLKLVEGLQGLERSAPPSTLGMVVEHNRLQLGNPDLRNRLERDWKRWPDPLILTYLGVVLALGVMVVMVSRIGVSDRGGTVILAPSQAPPQLAEERLAAEVWIEPGITEDEVLNARNATPEETALVLERLAVVIPSQTQVVVARVGEQTVRLELSAAAAAPQASSGE